jgi:stearoyl-CoA desaturase (delta-9 desaturase)
MTVPSESIPKSSASPLEGGLRRKTRWPSVILMLVTTLVSVVGVPFYVRKCGVSASEIGLMILLCFATIFSITVGYHRLYSHGAFKANGLVRLLVLFFGAGAFEQSALTWASQHRMHHKHVDTDLDPYNIRYGFWYAHAGWILFWKQPKSRVNVKDLERSRLVVNQHIYYPYWAVGAGIVFPTVVGALTGHALGGFCLLVALRLFITLHSAFLINSMAHTWGSSNYDLSSSARDNAVCAVLTNGEGYHNYHHRFPGDYRNGVRWYHYDPTKWLIWLLSKLGMAWDLRRTPDEQIVRVLEETKARRALPYAAVPT